MRARRRLAMFGLMLMLGLSLSAVPASAHGPQTHDRLVQVEPAVVHIETSATARVVLHDMGKPIFLQSRTYDVPTLSTGTGVVVNPSGTIVTARSVVEPDLAKAQIYAANKIVAEYYHVPVPGDPLVKHRLADPANDQRLQHCYETDELYMSGPNCVYFVTAQVRVFPFVTKPSPTGVAAEVLPGKPGDQVAVLSINGTNLPTAAISTSSKGATNVSTVGFLGAPTATTTPITADEHLSPPGAGRFSPGDLALVKKGLGTHTAGVPVLNADDGSIVALLDGVPNAPALIPAQKVTAALQSLGITARSSLVDSVFAEANAFYGRAQYRNAVPRLKEALRLDPDNALAAQMLQKAEKASGTPADTSNQAITATQPAAATSKGSSWSGWLIALLVVLALVIAALLTLRFGPRPRFLVDASRGPRTGPEADPAARAPAERGSGPPSTPRPQTSGFESPGRSRRVLDLILGRARTPLESSPDPRAASNRPQAVSSGAQPRSAGRHQTGGTGSATITGQRFCTQCGTSVGSGYRFCSRCGSEIE